jgi:transcriptional regulator with XRE-family HTH domain
VEAGVSIGETLAKARGQAGLSVAQVSELTRIRETIISGIERDDYAACGGDFYARGHIRAIAQAVGADSEPLIREYDAARPEPETIPPPPVSPLETPAPERPRRGLGWAAAVVLAIVIGLLIYLLTASHHSPAGHSSTGPSPRGTGTSNGSELGTTADPYAHKVVVNLTAVAGCQVDFTTPAGLLLLHAHVAAGTSKTWTFYRAVDMRLTNPGGIRLVVDGRNPLPPGVGARAVTLALGLSRAVRVTTPARVLSPAKLLHPARVVAFGPGGSAGDNGQLAFRAIDGNPGTAWHTDWYATEFFGGLKNGTGILIDMGAPVTITAAQISLGSAGGADVQLRVGRTASIADLPRVAAVAGAGDSAHMRLATPARGRYVLIWFTKLPPDSAGTFRASVYGVRLTGRA